MSPCSSLEMAKQKLQNDQLQKEAELKVSEKQKNLSELQKKFKKMLNDNQNLPEHIRLKPEVKCKSGMCMCALSPSWEIQLRCH